MIELFRLYVAPYGWLMHLDPLAGNLIVGLLITCKVGLGGWVLARTGRSPLWVLALLAPWADIAALWLFAFAAWPAEAMVKAALTPPASAVEPESTLC